MHHSIALSLLGCLLSAASVVGQSVPALMNYQGRLTDETGQPLPNGTYAVQFRLWNSAVAGQAGQTLVWGRQYDVTLVNGVFNAILGAPGGAAVPEAAAVNDLQLAFGDAERYLGLTLARLHDGTVVSDAQRKEIHPRQQLLSAPFAVMAGGLVADLADALCPAGSVLPFAGPADKVPRGWVLCDGRELSIAANQRLYGAIGSVWGNASSGNFRVPDFRGLFLRGAGSQGGFAKATGTPYAGESVGTFQYDMFQGHMHYRNPANSVEHNMIPASPNGSLGLSPGASHPADLLMTGLQASHDLYGVVRAGDETRPASYSVNFIIKR